MIAINNLDPRTKLLISACLSSLAVIITAWKLLAGVFLLSVLLLLAFGVNPRIMARKIRILIYVVIFIAVMQSVFVPGGQPLLNVGPVRLISTGGLMMALEFLLRIGIIVVSAGILSTSNSREIIQGLVQMKLPYEIAFMVSMGIRFLPVFTEEFSNAMIAVQLRGIDLKTLPMRQKIEVFAGVIQPVAAGALIKSRAVAISIEMRGFRACPKRTSYLVLDLRGLDYGVMGASALLTVLTLAWYFRLS